MVTMPPAVKGPGFPVLPGGQTTAAPTAAKAGNPAGAPETPKRLGKPETDKAPGNLAQDPMKALQLLAALKQMGGAEQSPFQRQKDLMDQMIADMAKTYDKVLAALSQISETQAQVAQADSGGSAA